MAEQNKKSLEEIFGSGSAPAPAQKKSLDEIFAQKPKTVGEAIKQGLSEVGDRPEMKVAAHLMGWPGSIVRGTGTGAYKALTGKPGALQDFFTGLAGKAPPMTETFQKEGVYDSLQGNPRGQAMAHNIANVLDFGSDIAGGLAAEKALEKTGRAFYNTAFSEADAIAKQAGKRPGINMMPSEAAWKNNMAGTDSMLNDQMIRRRDQLLGQREGLFDLIDQTGVEANLNKIATPIRQKIDLWKTPGRPGGIDTQAQAAAAFEKELNSAIDFASGKAPEVIRTGGKSVIIRHKAGTPRNSVLNLTEGVTELPPRRVEFPNKPGEQFVPDELGMMNLPRQGPYPSGIGHVDMPQSSFVYPEAKSVTDPNAISLVEKTIPETTVRPGYKGIGIRGTSKLKTGQYENIGEFGPWVNTSEGQELARDWARALKGETEALAERSGLSGSKEKLQGINDELGAILTPRSQFQRDALRESRRPGITQVDMTLAGISPGLLAAKQAGKAINLPLFQTGGGLLLGKGVSRAAGYGGKFKAFLDLLPPEEQERYLIDLQNR